MDKNKYDLTIDKENITPNLDLSQDIKSINTFLDYLKYVRNYSDKTITNYAIDMRQFLNYLSKISDNLKNMNRKALRRYIAFLNKEGFSSKSIHRKVSSIKSLYKYLTVKKVIENNPALSLSYPKLKKKLPEILSVNEIEALFDSFKPATTKEYRDKCIMELLYSSGIRVSELTGLNVRDVDVFSKTIKVLGKGRKERIAFISDRAIKSLMDYLNVRREILIENNSNSEALFLSIKGKEKGTRLDSTTVYSIVRKYSQVIVSGKKISPHTFRHSFATHIMNNGADIRLVQELLGHKSISSTQIYAHVSKERLRTIYRQTHPHAKE